MNHHVKNQIALEYLETSRHTKWQTAYRMHTAGARNMREDAVSRDWHMWRIVLEDVATGKQEAIIEQRHGDPVTFESFPTELTRVGEQFVIPGCERNASPKTKQLDLF